MILTHNFARDQDVPKLSDLKGESERNKKLLVNVGLNFVQIVLSLGILIKLVKKCKKI